MRGDRRDVAVHGIDGFEGDQLRPAGRCGSQQRVQMGGSLWRKMRFSAPLARMPLIIEAWFSGIGEDDAAGQQAASVPSVALVGDIARGEEQGRLLAMQVGQARAPARTW